MVLKFSLAEDTSEDTVLLLPGKELRKMFGNGEARSVLKLSQRVAYGFGHVMNDICAAMWFSYTLLFFEVVLEMPSVVAGSMIFLGQLADAIGSPIIGILVDRYGTRKSWHMIGTSLIAFSFSLVFSKCPWEPNFTPSVNGTNARINNSWEDSATTVNALSSLYYAVFVTIFQVGWATVQIAHLAIIPEMTPDKCGRADLTAIRYTATVCSSVFVYIVTWLILHFTGGSKESFGPKDFFKFKDVVLIGLLTGGIFTMLFHGLIRTPDRSKSQLENLPPESASTCFSTLKDYLKSRQLYQVTLIYFCSRMILSLSLLYMPLYLEENQYDNEYLATVPLVSYIASFLGSLAMGQIRAIWSSKISYMLGALISIGASAWIGIGLVSIIELFGVSALLGVGSAITGVASLCLCADLIGIDTKNGAFVYSTVTAVDKLLEGIAVIVIEIYKDPFYESSHYYQKILAYGCAISSVLGLVILLTMCSNSNQHSHKKSPKEIDMA